MENTAVELIEITDFENYLNKSFDITFSENVTMKSDLIEITKFEGRNQASRIPFSVVFRTDQKTQYYSQGLYKLNHPVLGTVELFFVPIGPDKLGMRYEANFS